jgi:hypothetical protein
MHTGFWWEGQKERDHYEDLDIGGSIILKWILETGWCSMDWTDLAQDRDQWRALVNMVMNLRFSQYVGKFLSSCTTGGFSRRAQLHGVN